MTPYNLQKMLILINITHKEGTHISSATATHAKQKDMHSGDHFGIAAVSTTCVLVVHCVSGTSRDGWRGFTTARIVTHFAFTYQALTVQSVSEDDRWQWERLFIALSSEPVRCYH